MIIALVVYKLVNNSGNFGWDVHGKTIWVCSNGKFPKLTECPERWFKIPSRNSEWKMCLPIGFMYPFEAFCLLRPVYTATQLNSMHSE